MGYIKDSVDGPGYTAPLLPTPSSGWTAKLQLEEEARQERIAKRRATYQPVFKLSAEQQQTISDEAYWDEVAAAQRAADIDIEFRGTGGPRIHPGTEIPVTAPHDAFGDAKWAGSVVLNDPGPAPCPRGCYACTHQSGQEIADSRTVQAGETRSVDPRTGAEKGTKLARFDLIPQDPLQQLAEHYGLGALKYDDHQWRAGYDFSKSYAALQRHLSAFWSGEEFDPDPAMEGATHLAAAAWHVFTLMEFMSTFPEGDDRWKKPQSSQEFLTRINKEPYQ